VVSSRNNHHIKQFIRLDLSFEKFFKENFSKFYAFTVRFVEDSYICEDLVQETIYFCMGVG